MTCYGCGFPLTWPRWKYKGTAMVICESCREFNRRPEALELVAAPGKHHGRSFKRRPARKAD